MTQIFVCGRCGYRAHHKGLCHNCKIHLEPMCEHCYCAKGNCICLLHGSPSDKIQKIKKDLKKRIRIKVKRKFTKLKKILKKRKR